MVHVLEDNNIGRSLQLSITPRVGRILNRHEPDYISPLEQEDALCLDEPDIAHNICGLRQQEIQRQCGLYS